MEPLIGYNVLICSNLSGDSHRGNLLLILKIVLRKQSFKSLSTLKKSL